VILSALLSDPPLDPSGDEARSWLRRELLKPEYNDENLIQRALHAFERLLDAGINAASSSSTLTALMSMLLLLGFVVALVLLVARARRAGARRAEDRAVLTDEVVTADDLRARAEAALADGRPADALVDAFRALTLRQVERGRIDDLPGATAHEVAVSLATAYPEERERVATGADRFDSIRYGDRPATDEQARDVLALDDVLAGRTVSSPAAGRETS